MNAPRPYQVCLYVGPSAPTLGDVRVVDLTPASETPAGVIEALQACGLTPADLRSRVLFVADGSVLGALLTYAALLGYAKRRIDVAFDTAGEVLVMSDFDQALRSMPDAGRPAEPPLCAQVGGPPRQDLAWVKVSAGFTTAAVSTIRYARRVRFVPPATLHIAVPQLVALAAFRARGATDRLPTLCDGSEPLDAGDEPRLGMDLDALRRAAEDLRRSQRSDNREALAPSVDQSPYLARLAQADAVPVLETLARLGASSKTLEVAPRPGTPEHELGEPVLQEVWHCPRPARHNNSDATPSARVHAKSGTFQCFKCDRERVGSLRLVMDVKDMTADEAADFLLSA